jgi:translation initiation factor IF-3
MAGRTAGVCGRVAGGCAFLPGRFPRFSLAKNIEGCLNFGVGSVGWRDWRSSRAGSSSFCARSAEAVFARFAWLSFGVKAISTDFRYNERIRISPVLLIDHTGHTHGTVPTAEALRMARDAGLDLVEVAPTARPPVCKILDYGKWKYQQQKKDDKARAHSKAGQLKEVKIKTVRIGEHDLGIKINHAREFLTEGNKVQFTLQFKGREIAHSELGYEIFKKIKEELINCSKVEQDAKLMGKRINMVLMPDNRGGAKAGEGKDKKPAGAGAGLNIPTPVARPAAPGAPAGGPTAPRPAPAAPNAPKPATPAGPAKLAGSGV